MRRQRDDFSPIVIRALRDRVNGICSNPGCKRSTIGPSTKVTDKQVITGKAAHICAASPGGPRYNSTQSPEERSSIENAIWLCGACADLVDKNGGADYPVTTLVDWKGRAEADAKTAQESPALVTEELWDSGLATVSYMNIPRLAMWAATQGIHLDLSVLEGVSKLHDMGWSLNRLMLQMENLLKRMAIKAVPIDAIRDANDDFTGATVAFDGKFFTKNGPLLDSEAAPKSLPSDWAKAPHIYCKLGAWKVVVVYDPKWLTTTTAYVEFRRGSRRFKGAGIVKEVDFGNRLVLISPLVIGLPKPDVDIFGDG